MYNLLKKTDKEEITVKGRNAKHGYYIFQYVYSSLMPGNQTWIKREEDENKSIYSGQHEPDKEKRPRKPIDNHTAKEKEEGHKNVAEMGNESEDKRTSESTQNVNERNENPSNSDAHQHHGNPSNRDIPQQPSEYIPDKGRNDTATDYTTDGIDGSGDVGFLGPDERHQSTISGNEHQTKEKDHQVTRVTEVSILGGRDEAVQSGISNDTKLSKGTHIKTGVKENEASVIQEINLHGYIPKKSKDSKSKDFLDVSVKVKNATSKEPGKAESGSVDPLDKGKEGNASARLQTHFNAQGEISGDLLGSMDHVRNGRNHTSFSDTDEIAAMNEIITMNGKIINYTRAHKKGGDEDIVLDQKLDGQKVIYGESKPPQKGEVRDNIISSKQTEVADVMKSHKNDKVKEDIVNGRSSSHIDVDVISKIHQAGEGEHITGRSIGQVENPISTQSGQTNQSRILSSGKLNGSGVTKSQTKSGGELTLLGGTSVGQRSSSGAINQSQKGTSEVGIIPEKSNNGAEGFHFTKAHQNKADSHEKINRKAPGGKQGDPERQEKGNRRLGVTFREGNKEVVKGNIGYRKAPATADLGIDSSGRKEENSGHKSVGIKSALTLAHGSHDYKEIAKSQEHSSYTLKNDRKLTKEPSKKTSRVHNGRRSSSPAERYRAHLGVLQRKSSRHERRGKSRKNVHASDSSQSSESEGNSRYDSRQSYEDYQNDNPDSYQSAESVEENLSAGSNQRDDCSRMEDIYSREDSQEHRRN
ncbi:UNVERIFIED_CONTAM: hypothetical protein K2H54_021807 [Gekko kuhli]